MTVFEPLGDRKAREKELAQLLEATLKQQSTVYWLDLLEQAGVDAGPIYDMEQVYEDPQGKARDMGVALNEQELGTLRHIGVPVKLSETPGSIRGRAPALGEHSEEVLLAAGYSGEEIEGLVQDGVVVCP